MVSGRRTCKRRDGAGAITPVASTNRCWASRCAARAVRSAISPYQMQLTKKLTVYAGKTQSTVKRVSNARRAGMLAVGERDVDRRLATAGFTAQVKNLILPRKTAPLRTIKLQVEEKIKGSRT